MYGYITMHGQQNIKLPRIFFMGCVVVKVALGADLAAITAN
jgi:hypothetical protein